MNLWLLVAGWALGWLLLWRVPGLPRSTNAAQPQRTVSVIIPARNEADRLPDLLRSLGEQTTPPAQILVVDDDSTDTTGEQAATFAQVTVLHTPPKPDGWAGKPWACSTGARAATGDLLVFLDADVTLAPAALELLTRAHHEHGGLLSVQPHHRPQRAVEHLSLPFNVVSMMGLGVASALPPDPQWGAAGPCLVTTAEDYRNVGGHAAVADEVAEDLALADRYRAADLPLTCLGGHDTVRFRMYRDLRGLVEGWSKNLAIGAGRTPRLRSIVIALWITAMLSAALRLLAVPTSTGEAVTWAAIYGAGALQVAWLGRQVGRFGAAALAWPLLLAGFVAIFLRSAVLILVLRRVRWNGRSLAISRR